MKKLILLLLLILFFTPEVYGSKEYQYIVERPNFKKYVKLEILENASLGAIFLTEYHEDLSWVEITFLGIDSNNNIHLKRRKILSKRTESDERLILKLEPGKIINLEMLYSIVKISITPINSSFIEIKLLPNEYIREEP